MGSSSLPTDLNVLETCWTTIEAFADLASTVAVARTCRALRRALVDPHSRRLTASHFEVDGAAPARPPHYVAHALNALHFPSLRRLHLDFPLSRRRLPGGGADAVDDAGSVGFPLFVAKLADAWRLESLSLNAGRLMATERAGRMEALHEVFGANLGRCGRLRALAVTNAGFVRGSSGPLYSVALMRALMPTLRTQRLEELTLVLEGTPSDPVCRRQLEAEGIDPVLEFFAAALSAERLRGLDLSLLTSQSHLTALIEAATFHRGAKPSRLRKLRLNYDHRAPVRASPTPAGAGASAAPLLEHFSGCAGLESLFLNLPRHCWEGGDGARALRRLLGDKPRLAAVTLAFTFLADEDGEMLRAIAEGLAPNIASGTLRKLLIVGLMEVDDGELRRLQLSLDAAGMTREKFNVPISLTGCGAGKRCSVMTMSYHK